MAEFSRKLTPLELAADTLIVQPERAALELVTAESPALAVMTDLRTVRLITTTTDLPIDTALSVMVHAKVRLLLVVDGTGAIKGLLSSGDLVGEKPLRVASEERITHGEVRVEQVMSSVAEIRPLALDSVSHATVRDVVRHLIDRGKQHVLVVSPGNNGAAYTAAGIFSLTQIGRQLGETINLGDAVAEYFADFERLIA
jgi:CBS domain-containing protein